MTKDGYVLAGSLLTALVAILAVLATLPFGVQAVSIFSAIAVAAMAVTVVHMFAMVLFDQPIIHNIGVAHGWWAD